MRIRTLFAQSILLLNHVCTFLGSSFTPVSAQTNLVPNPGFEFYDNCPTGLSDVIYNDLSFPFILNWFSATQFGTSDYFNACAPFSTSVGIPNTFYFGHNTTRHCKGMCGLFVYQDGDNYREYIEVELTASLTGGVNYYVEFYVSPVQFQNAGGGSYDFILAVDEFGAYFSPEKIAVPISYAPLAVEPQIENIEGNYIADSAQWYKISGNFIAEGGEKYLTIGNFKDDLETDYVFMNGSHHSPDEILAGYAFIDDVLVTDGTFETEEVEYCAGSETNITATSEGETFLWNTGDTTETITVDSDGIYSVIVNMGCDTMEYYYHAYAIPVELTTASVRIDICSSAFPLILYSGPGYTQHLWSNGDTTASVSVLHPASIG